MPALSTEGLILKRTNFGEADRVITALTDRFGKISIIARGVRKITSRRAGNVEVLNRVKLHLFKSKSYTLTEAQSLETFSKLKSDLTLTTYAFHIIELLDRLIPEEQRNPAVYNLAISILEILEKNPRKIFIRAFEVKLLALLGFWSIGAIPDLKPETKEALQALEFNSWAEIGNLKIEDTMDLERAIRYYIEKVLEGSLKSLEVLKGIK